MFNKLFAFLILLFVSSNVQAQTFFQKKDERKIQLRNTDDRTVIPDKYEVYNLDLEGLKLYLMQAPLEFSTKKGLNMQIPLSNGELKWFEVFESPVLQPGIAAKFPSIKSYKAYGLGDNAMDLRFAISPQGFYAAINTLQGEIYIDPYSEENIEDYIVYNVADHRDDIYKNVPLCGVDHEQQPDFNRMKTINNRTENVIIREYRLAMACTGEWGKARRRGTVELCVADINTMVTRLNSIFEREVSIRFRIIDENEKLIFLDPNNDPYENADKGLQIVWRNTEILNNLLPGGSADYDVGHVLAVCDDIGGVVAGGTCNASNKGNGVTCSIDNNLTRTVVSIMAHEIGHQFDASHTWNICKGIEGQRAANWAFEPGSGTTILSYAGACNTDNVAGGNDEYFHVGSLIQMFAKTTPGGVAWDCATKIITDNHQPVAIVPTEKYVIPIATPFFLEGSGTDEDGDVLTYCWEQFDLGPSISLGVNDNPEGPLFRSQKPNKDAYIRFFPKPASIMTGQIAEKSEALPIVSRTLNFKLTVRDNNPISEGVTWEDYSVEVTDKAGPFKVTYPETAQTFKTGQLITVTWDVANTDVAPVNCKKVNIFASYNGAIRDGDPNLVPLAMNVDNNGAFVVTIPDKVTKLLRIIVKAADHIILSSSASPSQVIESTNPELYVAANAIHLNICQPDEAHITYNTIGLAGFEENVRFVVIEDSLPKGVRATLRQDEIKAGESNLLTLMTEEVIGYQEGQVIVYAIAEGQDTIVMTTKIIVEAGDINNIQKLLPVDGAEGLTGSIHFNWQSKLDAVSYEFEIASNPDFSADHILESIVTQDTTYKISTQVKESTIYYWRVRAYSNCKAGDWSQVSSFFTVALKCNEYKSGLKDEVISTSSKATAEITLTIDDLGLVSDLNIAQIRASHGRLVDLSAYLVSPSGKEALLWSNQCGNQQNINVRLDDDAADFFQCPINSGKLYRTDVSKGADKLSIFNEEQMQGNWTLRLVDNFAGQGGKFTEFNLEICAAINVLSPYLVNNMRLDIHPGDKLYVSKDHLEAQDDDNTSSELTYTLVTVPAYGVVTLNGRVLNVGSTFTQADLNENRILYESESDYEGTTHFSFTVYDGNGGWIGITNFEIFIDQSIPVSTQDNRFEKQIFVYPNPVNEQVFIVVSDQAAVFNKYNLLDVSGRSVLNGVLSDRITTLNVQHLEKGIYILRLTDGKRSVSRKVVRM